MPLLKNKLPVTFINCSKKNKNSAHACKKHIHNTDFIVVQLAYLHCNN